MCAKQTLHSPDENDDLSPMPAPARQPRRGAFSAEPISEEDAATYVKKVRKGERGLGEPNVYGEVSSRRTKGGQRTLF